MAIISTPPGDPTQNIAGTETIFLLTEDNKIYSFKYDYPADILSVQQTSNLAFDLDDLGYNDGDFAISADFNSVLVYEANSGDVTRLSLTFNDPPNLVDNGVVNNVGVRGNVGNCSADNLNVTFVRHGFNTVSTGTLVSYEYCNCSTPEHWFGASSATVNTDHKNFSYIGINECRDLIDMGTNNGRPIGG